MKLTEKAVIQRDLPAELDEQFISDDDLTGLYLRLRRGAAGVVKSWVYRYTVAGARHKETVDFAGHSLAAARKWAGDLRARVRLGYDPGSGTGASANSRPGRRCWRHCGSTCRRKS